MGSETKYLDTFIHTKKYSDRLTARKTSWQQKSGQSDGDYRYKTCHTIQICVNAIENTHHSDDNEPSHIIH